jgi:hypothetical protein
MIPEPATLLHLQAVQHTEIRCGLLKIAAGYAWQLRRNPVRNRYPILFEIHAWPQRKAPGLYHSRYQQSASGIREFEQGLIPAVRN